MMAIACLPVVFNLPGFTGGVMGKRSKKSKKSERKKKKRQERIRQEKHARRSLPMWVKEGLDDEVVPPPTVAFRSERYLRGRALRTGEWVADWQALQDAAEAGDSFGPIAWPGGSLDGPASERAQELAYQAMEERDPARAQELAAAALALDPRCIDALRLRLRPLAEEDPEAARDRLMDLIEQTAPSIDHQQLERTGRRMNRLVSARPFLRLLLELAELVAEHSTPEALAGVLARIVLFDRLSIWHIAQATFLMIDEAERWQVARLLRERVSDLGTGGIALDGLLAWRVGDRRQAADCLRQAFLLNRRLQVRMRDDDRAIAATETDLEAAALAGFLSVLVDDLDGFDAWLDDGMPWMDAVQQRAALEIYSGPLAALLSLGEPQLGRIDAIDYRQRHSIDTSHRELLERMVVDPVFTQGEIDQTAAYAPIHAWRALAQLADPRSLPLLFEHLLDPEVGDWDYEELPEVIARCGAAALPQALEHHHTCFLDDDDEPTVLAMQRVLALIAERDPSTRATVVERLRWVVADPQSGRETSRASACAHLAELRAVECLTLIEQAYADGMVDSQYADLPSLRQQMAGEVAGG
jgi:hypothetical protein